MIIGISGKIGSGKDTVGKIIRVMTSSPHFTDEAVLSFLNKSVLNSDWEVKKFADKLKDMVCMLLGCTREDLEDRDFKEQELGEEWWVVKHSKLRDDVVFAYDSSKEYSKNHTIVKLTPRLLMQLVGTECGRRIIHPNIWVNALMSEYKPSQLLINKIRRKGFGISPQNLEESLPKWVITDMRFPNELKAVKDKQGITIRVNREIKHQIYSLGGKTDVPAGHFPSNEHVSETALDNAGFDYIIENDGTLLELVAKVRYILKEHFRLVGYPYEFICKDCGEDFASKDPKSNCAQCSSPNVKKLN